MATATSSGTTTVELDRLPGLSGLLGRVATGAMPWADARGDAAVPDTRVVVHDVVIDADAVADHAAVCGDRLRSTVPVTFPHLLGFPLSMWLMTRPDFPFGVLGAIHVANRIEAHDHVAIGDRVDVAATVGPARPHDRGVQFDCEVEVRRDGTAAWSSASTYLRPGPAIESDSSPAVADPSSDGAAAVAATVDVADLPLTARWALPGDLGRRYAAVTGDRNPIHLSAATARAFGFPRAIAHGMWTLGAATAGLGRLDRPVRVDVAFKRPILLPGRVEYATRRRDDGWEVGVRSRDGTPHLAGVVTPS